MGAAAKEETLNPWLHLELPEQLPEGVDRAQAAEVLERLKGSASYARMAAKVSLAEMGVFTAEALGLDDPKPQKRRKVSEAAARGNDRSDLPPIGGESRPAAKNTESELHVINGFIRLPGFRPKFLEVTTPEQLSGVSQRKVLRLAVDLHDQGKPVEYVLLRDLLSRDGTAVDVGACESLDDAISRDTQTEETLLELARNIRDRFAEREEIAGRRRLAELSLDGGMRNGVFLKAASEIFEAISDRAHACEDDQRVPRGWPAPVASEANYGLIGTVLDIVRPQTVADPMAILSQFLVAAGSIVGRGPCWYYEDTRHSLALYLVLAGPTALGGKGTAWSVVERIFDGLNPDWDITTGLISGEGLIEDLSSGMPKLYIEEEFAAILAAAQRKGNTLGPFVRKSWDGRKLAKKSSTKPTSAEKYHLSAIFHITVKELASRVNPIDKSNGHYNRMLWCCSRSGGGDIERKPINWERNGIRDRLKEILEWIRGHTAKDPDTGLVLARNAEASRLWAELKPKLRAAGGGPLGPLRARGLPYVMRMAGIYAVLDMSALIRADHLRAAMAVWEYCARSVAFVFRGGDDEMPPLLGRAFRLIVESGSKGMTVREIARKVFGHKHGPAVEAVEDLIRDGLVMDQTVETGGHPKTLYKAAQECL